MSQLISSRNMRLWLLLAVCIGTIFLSPLAFADGNALPGVSETLAKQPYNLLLQNLFISHGVLEPSFRPDVLRYVVNLRHAHDHLAVTPEIDQSRPEYQGGEGNLPVITFQWTNQMNNQPESASIAVRRQIDLPDRGEPLDVYINVVNPHNSGHTKQYTIRVNQSNEFIAILKFLEGVDDLGRPAVIESMTGHDSVIYNVYVNPDAESVSFKPHCADGNWVKFDGRSAPNNALTIIPREKNHHRQVVELTCGKSSGLSSSVTQNYILAIYSNFVKSDIPFPRIVVDGRGKDCFFNPDRKHYSCPNPRNQEYRTRLVGFVEPSIRYTIESSDESVQVRILDKTPTIPFLYTGVGNFHIVALSGQHNVTWPIRFNGAPAPGFMRVVGWMIGILLLALLLSLLSVLSLSNTFGIGTPIGVTEIATAMTLLLQFFCFSSALRGSNLLSDMTEAMKWVTLYWPLPWTVDRQHNNFSRWGDVSDVTNAYGCLFWCIVIFSVIMTVHGVVIGKFRCINRQSTLPHRLAFGNWESRCLHWLAFPVATASGMILSHPDASPGWKTVSACAVGVYFIWATGVFIVIQNSISTKKVVWVWHNSAREDGELEDEAGYWSDINCDQLLTQPVNRSLFKWFFPWRWVSTVADIDAVNICPITFSRSDEETGILYAPNEYSRSHKEGSYPLGKNPKIVDVYRTMPPSYLCPGQRLVSGLFRTQWLDVLFTFQGLTNFHSHMAQESGRDFIVPLTVKTCQLTGPVTGGTNHFFYDGIRIPFIRIGDTLFRLLVGLLMGLTLASDSYKLDAGIFGTIGSLSLGLLVYHFVGHPYARKLENWIIGALLCSMMCTAFAFMGYSITKSEPSVLADIFLWLNAFTSILLSLYACVVIFSVYSAIMCPPLEETRFLEKLANCNITIADHEAGWAVDVPAYNKNGARDLKAQCTMAENHKVHVSVYPSGEEATIEFNAHEMLQACQSGSLRPPVLSLFCPDSSSALGYRHLNVYDRGSLHADVTGFMAMDSTLRHLAQSVSRNIAHQVEVRGRGKTVVSLTIVPPRVSHKTEDWSADESTRAASGHGTARHRYRSGYTSIEMSQK